MERRLAPPAFTVERMAPLGDGVELLIGARWDARFGPIALVGLGGLFTEILARRRRGARAGRRGSARGRCCSRCAPRRCCSARAGARELDVDAAAAALAALSRVAAEHPEIAAIEVNPLLALPAGALGLDARLERAA